MKAIPEDLIDRLDGGGRILVSRLRHLGDVVLTLPLVEALRESFPQAQVHYLAEANPLLAVREHPCVHSIWESPRSLSGMWSMARRLHHQAFDLSIDLFANPRSALLLFASGASVRLGEDRRLRRHLYTHARHLVAGRTALQQHLAVLEDLGRAPAVPRKPMVHLSSSEYAAGKVLRESLLRTEKAVVLHVDASHPSKEWPTERWAALIGQLQRRGFGILISRAPGEAVAHRALLAREDLPQGAVFLPTMPLRSLLGLLVACDGIVSVDGGVMHCAVGLGIPTVALFGPTDASIWFPYEEFGPYRVLHLGAVESQPQPRLQQAGCLQALDVANVEETLIGLLASITSPGDHT